MRRRWLCSIAVLLALAIVCSHRLELVCHAHPFHISMADVEYNATTARLEVALRVFPLELERALLIRNARRVDLDSTPEIDRLIAEYLRTVFVVTLPSGDGAALAWLGKDVGIGEAWLYFEYELPAGMQGVRIENRIFHELEADQANTINLRVGDSLSTLICRRESSTPPTRTANATPRAPEPTPPLRLLRTYPCRGRFLLSAAGAGSARVPRCTNSFEHLLCECWSRRAQPSAAAKSTPRREP